MPRTPKIFRKRDRRPVHIQAEEIAYKNLSFEFGHLETVRIRECIDAAGEPIPWYTYPAIEYLLTFKLSGLSVLEYGSGNSSLWYAGRGCQVTSIESNDDWARKVRGLAEKAEHDDLHVIAAEGVADYAQRAEVTASDIIVIDGVLRAECAAWVVSHVAHQASNPALIVFDNSDRYPHLLGAMDTALKWIRADFSGFGPINEYTWSTSVFLNPRRALERHALAPKAGLGHLAEDDSDALPEIPAKE